MGQTLTHGIYLPDEGERNCYNGLAANWQLLDGAVGTVAEHTTALAGKAPAVHTHSKADITDFPAYGTTAGTICEGNDSRLSDARTPLSHTHTKANITDLLNSNFIPSANNSYDLGSSSYQWNNLYAKNYYYNGVAWGLDKSNAWTSGQYFRKTIIVQNSVAVSAGNYDIGINFFDSVGNRYGYIQPYITTSNQKRLMLGSDTGELSCNSDLIPANNNLNCGNSTLKWKTLNGINPGALSLPDYTLAKVDLIDFSQWSVAGQPNAYTPTSDGWLMVSIKDTASNSLFIYAHGLYNADPTKSTDYSASCFGNGSQGLDGRIAVMFPVRAGIVYRIYIKAASVSEIYSAKFYPALGNV